jgi:hypothetical protein
MAKINRPNNIVTIGQTAPVGIGQGSIENSLPVVVADNQPAIPVVEQNKIQSEVALSLLGIPRSEVALGIFADVNTYDVDPSEWSQKPIERSELTITTNPWEYETLPSGIKLGHGLSHVPEEAGALLEAPRNKSSVLTSKRFFRYQPGRVSAATFGVKTSITPGTLDRTIRNPSIRKYGIFDKFDGYYWETRDAGIGDQFCVVRRTQALIKYRTNFDPTNTAQQEDYGIVGSDDTSTSIVQVAAGQTGATIVVTKVDSSTGAPKPGMSIYDTAGNATGNPYIKPNTRIETVTRTGGIDDSPGATYTLVLSNSLIDGGVVGSTTNFKCDFSGNLAIIRDKLLMTHAAIYDPTLLKDEQSFTITAANSTDNTLTISSADAANLEVGQMVMYNSTTTTTPHFANDSIFIIKELNTTTGVLKLYDVKNAASATADANVVSAASGAAYTLKTPVPFIFPEAQVPGGLAGEHSAADIMWPYARGFGFDGSTDQKRQSFGTNTVEGAIQTDTLNGFNATLDIKQQLENVNNGIKCASLGDTDILSANPVLKQAWSQWIRHNVQPKFYGVYEYRVPRSRFSFDFLDGSKGNRLQFSDFTRIAADGAENEKLPGDSVAGIDGEVDSLYEIDFEKVLMNKIEFSWYGAVGALFLVYVPVGNGEARWVRVHHLRASNQLKVASLGNATLPLTYNIFGGGTPKTLGRSISAASNYAGGKTASEFVIKYGSSYYIDGGDRGTVKLFNYSNEELVDVESNVYVLRGQDSDLISPNGDDEIVVNYSAIKLKSDNSPSANIGKVDDIFMGAKVKTSNAADTNVTVRFVERIDENSIRLHLNRNLSASTEGTDTIELITNTGQAVYGLTSKTNITSSQGFQVRNRVQVYPTKLSAALTSTVAQADSVKLELNKNAIYQEDAVYSILEDTPPAYGILPTDGTRLEVTGLATRLDSSNSTGDFNGLSTTDKLYGWFFVENTDGGNPRALFGYVYKLEDDVFEFFPLESYTENLQFQPYRFLFAKQYAQDGSEITSAQTIELEEIERLSSIQIVDKQQRPIAGTGTKLATFFLEKGTEYFDLSPYFDYNKDYISFPLTDVPDNLFFVLKADDTTWNAKVGLALTWEEQ